MTTSYKLIYFQLRGRAAVIRMLFALAEQKYEDFRLEFNEWPQAKLSLPFHQAPVLEVTEDSKTYKIGQSVTISRFLANRFGYGGRNDIEKAQVDMVVDECVDIVQLLIVIYKRPESEEKTKELSKAFGESLPNMYQLIQNILEKNQGGNGYLVGDALTYADLYLIYSYDWLRERKEEILSNFPLLKSHYNRIRSLPKLAEHLDESSKLRLTILFSD